VPSQAIDLIREGYAALNDGRHAEWAAALPSDFELIPPTASIAGSFVGPEGVVSFFDDAFEAWETMRIELEEVIEFDGRVVVLGRIRNRGRGSGMDLDVVMAHVWTIENDVPIRAEMIGDRDEALRRGREGV
jgi:ketosteroid isomerase-like protein